MASEPAVGRVCAGCCAPRASPESIGSRSRSRGSAPPTAAAATDADAIPDEIAKGGKVANGGGLWL